MPIFECKFFVQGKPATQGSKRAFVIPGTNRASLVDDCKRNKPWRADVRAEAQLSMRGRPAFLGPVRCEIMFFLDRPMKHYRGGDRTRGLRPDAPAFPTTKPDVIKLGRAVEDALKGLVWKDDSQVVCEILHKLYQEHGRPEGAMVSVTVHERKEK